MPLITLTSDFCSGSPYVAAMKGVILGIAPDVTMVDLTHDIHPQSIRCGAVTLLDFCDVFPAGTIHVAVVDPGVGTTRKVILVETRASHFFIGPDNGLLSPVAEHQGVVAIREITNQQLMRNEISSTFHGRDIMAPVAAHLASGVSTESVGPRQESMLKLEIPRPNIQADVIQCMIIAADGFGNLITNLTRRDLERTNHDWLVLTRSESKRHVRWVKTYGEAGQGELVALLGSSNRLEFSTVDGSAARETGWVVGQVLRLKPQ